MFKKTTFLMVILMSLAACSAGPDIPFSELEPYWSSWKKYEMEGESGIFCKNQGEYTAVGMIRGTMNQIAFDGNGMQVPPTKPGSKIIFETDGCELAWIGGIRIKAEERLVFSVAEEGLVYSSGKGTVSFRDDRTIEY
jgi:hypothetical protein